MSDPASPAPPDPGAPAPASRLSRLSIDWWTVIIGGALVVLALFDVLPTIGW